MQADAEPSTNTGPYGRDGVPSVVIDLSDTAPAEGEHRAPIHAVVPPSDGEAGKALRPPPFYKRPLVLAVAAVVLLVGGSVGGRYVRHALAYESTDDAFIEGHIIPISPKVAGQVLQVYVTDNQEVQAGELLVEIDPRDFEARLAQAHAAWKAALARRRAAERTVDHTSITSSGDVQQTSAGVQTARSAVQTTHAQLAASRARIAQADAQVTTAVANAAQARAQVVAAEAETMRANADAARYQQLYARDFISHQDLDHAIADARTANARLDAARKQAAAAEAQVAEAHAAQQMAAESLRQAESQVAEAQARVGEALGRLTSANAAPEQVAVRRAQVETASAEIEQAEAAVRQAELELSYTKIYAPEAGRVTRKSVEEGVYVQVGQALLAVVPHDVWVIANFKETQLTSMRPGQPAEIHIDAYPDKIFRGHVDSIQAGTGVRFSLLPPENATGNYVKVVQRVPVKIVFDGPPDPQHVRAPGMSVVPEVKVK